MNNGGLHVADRSDRIAAVLAAVSAETGRAGPFIIGTLVCHLCGHWEHCLEPIKVAVPPKLQSWRCDRCGQREMEITDDELE